MTGKDVPETSDEHIALPALWGALTREHPREKAMNK
jgi:hypothetical protein